MADSFPNDTNPYPNDTLNLLAAKIARILKDGAGGGGGGGLTDTQLRASPVPVSLSGNGAVTIADGADVTQGAKADAAATTDTGTFSIVALLKRLLGYQSGTVARALVLANGTANTNGAFTAGAVCIGIFFSDDFVGTVNGIAYSGSDGADFKGFDAIPGRTWPAIAYTISAGSFTWETAT